MFVITGLTRKPKESEMALSQQTKESIDTASQALREALAFAARTEHIFLISSLSDVLSRLESLEHMDDLMERFCKQPDIPTNLT